MSERRKRDEPIPVAPERGPGSRLFTWPEELVEWLGAAPDYVVARRARVTPATVAAARRRRGIPPFRRSRPVIQWTPEMIAALGRASDADIARDLRIPRHSVKRKRRQLGIPPHETPTYRVVGFDWTPRALARLGKIPDLALARKLGISCSTVQAKRQRLGIPPFRRLPAPVAWSKKMVSLLGLYPDTELARRWKIDVNQVRRKRQRLQIAPALDNRPLVRGPALRRVARQTYAHATEKLGIASSTFKKLREEYGVPSGRTEPDWMPEILARLGKESDAKIAAATGISEHRIRAKRTAEAIAPSAIQRPWSDAEIALLATATDATIAARLGRTKGAVLAKRRALRIPAHRPSWKPAELTLLGTAPDLEVARRLGRSRSAVSNQRRQHGIPPWTPSRSPRSAPRAHRDRKDSRSSGVRRTVSMPRIK